MTKIVLFVWLWIMWLFICENCGIKKILVILKNYISINVHMLSFTNFSHVVHLLLFLKKILAHTCIFTLIFNVWSNTVHLSCCNFRQCLEHGDMPFHRRKYTHIIMWDKYDELWNGYDFFFINLHINITKSLIQMLEVEWNLRQYRCRVFFLLFFNCWCKSQ